MWKRFIKVEMWLNNNLKFFMIEFLLLLFGFSRDSQNLAFWIKHMVCAGGKSPVRVIYKKVKIVKSDKLALKV